MVAILVASVSFLVDLMLFTPVLADLSSELTEDISTGGGFNKAVIPIDTQDGPSPNTEGIKLSHKIIKGRTRPLIRLIRAAQRLTWITANRVGTWDKKRVFVGLLRNLILF